MKTVWKVLLGLALVVPMGAYVVGSLAASAADDPEPRQTIQIREPDPTPMRTPKPTPASSQSPTKPPPPQGSDDVEVITPDYDDFDDDDDHGDDDRGDDDRGHDDRDDDREHDDDSGHGGGEED